MRTLAVTTLTAGTVALFLLDGPAGAIWWLIATALAAIALVVGTYRASDDTYPGPHADPTDEDTPGGLARYVREVMLGRR